MSVVNIEPFKCKKCKNTGKYTKHDSYFGDSEVFCKCGFGLQAKLKWDIKQGPIDDSYGIVNLGNDVEGLAKKGVPGLEIVKPEKFEIQLDYDYDEIPAQFNKVLEILRQRFPKGHLTWEKYRSSSGKHWHVVIKLPEDITDQERIVWQAVFGSDYIRESLNLLRLVNHLDPQCLYMQHERTPVEVVEIPEIPDKPGRKFKDA